jgi:hypothetical protein
VYAHLNNDNARYDFGINAAGVNGCGSTAGATVQGIQLGLRHSF